jgi:uncharacterized protein DUF2795
MAETNPIDVQKALKGASYPADRDALVSVAKKNGADASFLEKLGNLGQKQFDGPNEVQQAVFNHK